MDEDPLPPVARTAALAGRDQPVDPFVGLRREMDYMLHDFTRDWPAPPPDAFSGDGFLSPLVNMSETEAGIEITADMPGVDPRNIELELEDGVLTLRAARAPDRSETDETKRYHLVERASGVFFRRFALPFEVEDGKIEAVLDKGVLMVTAPRAAAAAKQQRRIEVRVS